MEVAVLDEHETVVMNSLAAGTWSLAAVLEEDRSRRLEAVEAAAEAAHAGGRAAPGADTCQLYRVHAGRACAHILPGPATAAGRAWYSRCAPSHSLVSR